MKDKVRLIREVVNLGTIHINFLQINLFWGKETGTVNYRGDGKSGTTE